MRTFDQLTFNQLDMPGHLQALARFGNKYELSVVKMPRSTMYEVAIFDVVNDVTEGFVQLPGIHPNYGDGPADDVIAGLTPADVEAIMLKLATVTMSPKEVDFTPV